MLQKYFDIEVSKIKKYKLNEKDLFIALCNVINRHYGIATIYHGPRGFVDFDIHLKTRRKIRKTREISDLFLVFVGKDEIRYTFMQNKYSRQSHNDFKIPRVETCQHYLLANQCQIYHKGRTLPKDILSSAILPGVASYGIFYDDKPNYGMIYLDAFTMVPKRGFNDSIYTTYTSCEFVNSFQNNAIYYSKGWVEFVHATNLDDFEWKFNNMMIGTPLIDGNPLKPFILNYISYAFRNCNNDELVAKLKERTARYSFDNLKHFDLKTNLNIALLITEK